MYYFSNEIVFRGHPDKVCDQISGALLNEYLKGDKSTRAGIEVVGGKGKIFITGEVTSNATVDVEKVVMDTLESIGYDSNIEVINNIGKQSRDIAQGVDIGGAGDQGMMFGYACMDNQSRLPKAMVILQDFAREYDVLVRTQDDFLPDGKAQITGIYSDEGRLLKIKDFVISYQNIEENRAKTDGLIKLIASTIADLNGVEIENFHINPTGKFKIGGFEGDAGLTGRKIVVDAYQSFANVGGGCMNGKDPTKVDFSGAHKARELAKRFLNDFNVKHEGYACEVQLSYAIGMDKPLAIYCKIDGKPIEVPIRVYDECTPSRIIEDLGLKELDYEGLAKFGHFS